MSAESVWAILDGYKTQARRVIKPQPGDRPFVCCSTYIHYPAELGIFYAVFGRATGPVYWKYPYGRVGDRLWVRETWQCTCVCPLTYSYRADGEFEPYSPWQSAIFMPRKAARIFLEITGIRVERVQDISETDALAEGCGLAARTAEDDWPLTAVYAQLWDHLNAKRGYGWDVNPWCWVTEFRNVTAEVL